MHARPDERPEPTQEPEGTATTGTTGRRRPSAWSCVSASLHPGVGQRTEPRPSSLRVVRPSAKARDRQAGRRVATTSPGVLGPCLMKVTFQRLDPARGRSSMTVAKHPRLHTRPVETFRRAQRDALPRRPRTAGVRPSAWRSRYLRGAQPGPVPGSVPGSDFTRASDPPFIETTPGCARCPPPRRQPGGWSCRPACGRRPSPRSRPLWWRRTWCLWRCVPGRARGRRP